jgi:N4-gp56 family major capsid protein
MAVTSYGVNDPLAVKVWSKRLSIEVLKNTWASRFMGTSSASVIQIKDELQKGSGDKITYGLRMQLSGTGVLGDGTLEGNEESLTTYSDAVVLNQLRHAVRSAGRMSQQRVPFNIRDEALSGLRDWWADRLDYSFFNQICGYTPQTQVQWTGLQAPIAPDNAVGTGHYLNSFSPSSVQDQDITSTFTYVLTLIDRAVERARTLVPAIRPVKVDGKDYWVTFLHPYQVTDLRTNTATGQWLDIQKAAMTGGEIEDNPIFDGALGVYNGAILHSDYRVAQGVNLGTGQPISTVRRAVLCGAQACMLAYGRDNGPERYTWVEELFDYENELGVSAGLIFGLKKTNFNSMDFATVVTASYAAAH